MADQTGRGSFDQFKTEFAQFVEREKELAKAELVPSAKSAGIGAGMFAGAGVFALHALWMLILCLALGIGWALASNTQLSPWGAFTIGFLISALISLLVALVLFKFGQSKMKQVKSPTATIAEATATFSSLVDAAQGKQPGLELVEDPDPAAPAEFIA